MPKEISLNLSLTNSKGNISILHDFEKINKNPFSIMEISRIKFIHSNTTLLKDLELFDILKNTEFNINISDSLNLCNPSFIREKNTNDYTSTPDNELIFGELDFHNENIEISIWWIINNPSKFSMITNSLTQSESSTFEIILPQDLFHDIKKNSNFFFYPNRIKTKSVY
jgi:hypothetical protein